MSDSDARRIQVTVLFEDSYEDLREKGYLHKQVAQGSSTILEEELRDILSDKDIARNFAVGLLLSVDGIISVLGDWSTHASDWARILENQVSTNPVAFSELDKDLEDKNKLYPVREDNTPEAEQFRRVDYSTRYWEDKELYEARHSIPRYSSSEKDTLKSMFSLRKINEHNYVLVISEDVTATYIVSRGRTALFTLLAEMEDFDTIARSFRMSFTEHMLDDASADSPLYA